MCNQLRGAMETEAGWQFREFVPVEYATQVVAGINYFVKVMKRISRMS